MNISLLVFALTFVGIIYTKQIIYKLDKLSIHIKPSYYIINSLFSITLYLAGFKFLNAWINLIIFFLLYLVSTIDKTYFEIPDKYFLIIFALGIFNILSGYISILDSLKGFAVFVFFFIVILIAEYIIGTELLGGGDLKIFLSLGFFLGFFKAYLLLLFSHLLRIVVLAFTRIFRVNTKDSLQKEVAFGPYIYLAFNLLMIIEYLTIQYV